MEKLDGLVLAVSLNSTKLFRFCFNTVVLLFVFFGQYSIILVLTIYFFTCF